jgi:hypothetical protein
MIIAKPEFTLEEVTVITDALNEYNQQAIPYIRERIRVILEQLNKAETTAVCESIRRS